MSWLKLGGKYYNPQSGLLLDKEDMPATTRFEHSMGNDELFKSGADLTTEDGKRFVIVSFCTGFYVSKSGKTRIAKFLDFDVIDKGNTKVRGVWKEVDNQFEIGQAYLMLVDCLGGKDYFIIKAKKLNPSI